MNVNLELLKRIDAFEDLPEEELLSLAKLFRERRYQKNDIVFLEEDTGKYAYVVKEGRVKVSRMLPSGRETILAFHETGEYFGEMSLIDGKTAPATVTAVVPSSILSIGQSEFRGGPHRLDYLAAFLRWTPQFLLPPVREILRGGEPEGKVPLRMFFQASVHLLRRRPSVRRVRSLAVV